ncbi:MAG: twin-arginine translocase subunit TatC [Phycisphaerales bacterium]
MLAPVIDRRNKDSVMGLGEHLEELRRRVILALIAVIPVFGVSLYFGKEILAFLLAPVQKALHDSGQSGAFQATGVLETFGAYIKISMVLTLLAAGPWIIYQLWKFVAPGLYSHERRFAHVLTPLSAVLSILGASFAYYVMLPVMLLFLITFGASIGVKDVQAAPLPAGISLSTITVLDRDPPSPTIGQWWVNTELNELRICTAGPIISPPPASAPSSTTTPAAAPPAAPAGLPGRTMILGVRLTTSAMIDQVPRVQETADLLLMMGLAFVGAFQTPVVVLLLGWAGIVEPKLLTSYRKHVLAACAVLSAVLTPSPDPFSMLLLLLPMYGLYELGVLLLRILPAARIAGARDPAAQAAEEDPGGPATGP